MRSGIYRITIDRSSEGKSPKSYIGQSRNIEKRWKSHKTSSFNKNSHVYHFPLCRSIRKYGLENVTFEVLEFAPIKILNELEEHYIFWVDTLHPNGYNMNSGGGQKWTVSEETRRKISKANKGKRRSVAVRKKISQSLLGEKSPNWGKPVSEEAKKKISKANKGKRRTEEQLKKMSIAQKKRKGNRPGKTIRALDIVTGLIVKEFKTIRSALDWLGIPRNSGGITNCLKERAKSAYGYVWRYV